jgi:hypothetical protein
LQQVRNPGDNAGYAVHKRTGNASHQRAVTLRSLTVSQPHLRANAEEFLSPNKHFSANNSCLIFCGLG